MIPWSHDIISSIRLAVIACWRIAVAATVAFPTLANDVTRLNVQFAPGSSGASYSHRIQGYQSYDYLLRASRGQTMHVSLGTKHRSNYFNVYAPGGDSAMHIGSIAGNNFTGTLPSSGMYRIQVYLMHNAARRGETTDYRISFEIHGQPSAGTAAGSNAELIAPGQDYADGLAGGPDFWAVIGVGADDQLNVRTGPTTRSEIVSRLSNGTVVRNLGCRMSEEQRWCRVGVLVDDSTDGWVNGRYLRESADPGYIPGAAPASR